MGCHGFLLSRSSVYDEKVVTKCKQGQPLWAAMVFYCYLEGYLIREWLPSVNKGSLCGPPWFSIVTERVI